MLTEDLIIKAVMKHLTGSGWSIVSCCTVNERGDDIVAERDGRRLSIEAKGARSSKALSSRFGKEFSGGQVFDHVAKAILKALRVVAAGEMSAGIALPDNANHRAEVSRVSVALAQLGIAVYWVDAGGGVRIEPCSLPCPS